MYFSTVDDPDVLWLINNIIESYSNSPDTGIPLGNVTSQLFANVYLNQLDRFIKHDLHVKHYFRYADDFILLHQDKNYLEKLINAIDAFLQQKLKLRLHPQKVFIRKLKQGIDFLGYVCFPYHRVIRTKTKKRMFKKFHQRRYELLTGKRTDESFHQTLQSYLGLLKHANGHRLSKRLENFAGIKSNQNKKTGKHVPVFSVTIPESNITPQSPSPPHTPKKQAHTAPSHKP